MAASALGALLDRSLVQMADASADARTYDRQTIHTVSDVWDNNTFLVFRALAARTSWGRNRRARAALAWMAALGVKRRTWMVEQSAIAGYDLESLLPPPMESDRHHRDYQGVVRAPTVALTTEVAAGIGVDYDLATAEVRSLVLERLGTRLTGTLAVAARRRYASERPADEVAELWLWLDEVTDARFDSRDSSGITMGYGTSQVAIGMGKRGILRAVRATIHPDDMAWHLSAAGRALDARTPTGPRPSRRTPLPRRQKPLDDGPSAAVTILHHAMLEIRMVRYAHHAGQIPVRSLCLAFAGAGESILAASAHRRASRREKAFRQLVEGWVRKGGPDLAPWFAGRLRDLASKVCGTTREWVNSLMPLIERGFEPGRGPVSDLPAEAELRLAKYVAAHTRYDLPRAGTALVQLAVPPRPQAERDEVWDLCGLEFENPHLFQVSDTAFHGATNPQLIGTPEAVRSLSLSGGDLTMSADEAETREKRVGQSWWG
ncbi:hypothetical protein GCM10022224_082780 [Nonomuraea antimicrobica]|uniref:Uncharacterized protein n=2 Tax=Nonomuraea antimicrobica TaxID=561173 RepID=A0ABP7DHR3_9ACTN